MSTKPFDGALDAPRRLNSAGEPRPLHNTVALFFRAIGEGLAAQCRYQTLVARGVPADQAVGIAFNETFGKR
jgi:hypothetical protein